MTRSFMTRYRQAPVGNDRDSETNVYCLAVSCAEASSTQETARRNTDAGPLVGEDRGAFAQGQAGLQAPSESLSQLRQDRRVFEDEVRCVLEIRGRERRKTFRSLVALQ